jgi:hypothetical protein
MVIVVNACLGSWKCGKGCAFITFSQPLFLLFEHEFHEKFTIQRGEGGASASHPRVETLFKRLVHLNLTLQYYIKGG